MKIYLATLLHNGWHFVDAPPNKNRIEKMKIFLAGENGEKKLLQQSKDISGINILESYYYLRANDSLMPIAKKAGAFLLDSGAFTFLSKATTKVDWDKYIETYAAFINKWDIQLFFELDIDSIVGLQEVERLRAKLEALTGKKSIPVWHKNRGKDYFIKMCEVYPYVALGGIVQKEIPRKKYEPMFSWFIKTAHEHGAKIHGLGYTNLLGLKRYHFDSVDSSSWLHGNIGGYIYMFNPDTGLMEQRKKEGCRLKTKEGAQHNFREWVKFSMYANIKL